MAIDRDLGRRSPPMRSPGTIDDRARDIAPDGVPFNFYNRGPMDPPSRRFPMPTPPRMPIPMPTPNPFPDPRMPMPMPLPPPRNFGPAPMPNIRAPRTGEGAAGMTQQEMRRKTGSFDMPNPSSREGIMDSLIDSFRDNYKNLLPPFVRPAAAAVDPSDFRTIQKLLDAGLDPNDYIQAASMAYDDDDYGPFIPPSVIEMDRFGTGYGPQDEYLFDRERGFENRIFGKDPDYREMSGIMSALPQETQMAKLNESQRQALGTRANRFSYGSGESSPQDMLNKIRPLDKQPSFFGLFPGNEANEQDIIDFYKNNLGMVG